LNFTLERLAPPVVARRSKKEYLVHVHFLDPYRPRSSLVHALDARVKFILTVAFILTCALTPPGAWPVFVLLFSIVLAVELLSELGVGYVLKRSLLAAPFVLAALPLIFTVPGRPLVSLPIGGWALTITLEGAERLLSIAVKSWLSLQAAIVMSASMPFPDLLLAMRAVRVPRLLVAILGLMWRYLFVLVDEAVRLMRARLARSGLSEESSRKSGGSLAWRAQVAGGMAGNLFLRGFERSDRIYTAMLSRGYDGEVRALPTPAISKAAWLILFSGLLLLVLLLALGFLL
jgi:cobalt/nickel transport system permease protein